MIIIKTIWKDIRKHLSSGVSFIIPIVAAGDVILAVSLLDATQTRTELVPNGPLLTYLNQPGKAGIVMMTPVFAIYTSYSVAGKPDLTPGFILGYVANNVIMINGVRVKAGFLGALILGLLADYMAKRMKGLKVGKVICSVIPILVIPISTILILGLAYYSIIGYPIFFLTQTLSGLMVTLSGSGKAMLAVFMGFFSEIDLGGPMTKAASVSTLSMIDEGIMEPSGIFRVLVAVPPIRVLLSTIIAKKKCSEGERDSAKVVGIMGYLGITERAVPYAIKSPRAVYSACIIRNIVGTLIGAFGNVVCPVPHDGFIVLPVVENQLWFVVAIFVGSVIATLPLKVLKKDALKEC